MIAGVSFHANTVLAHLSQTSLKISANCKLVPTSTALSYWHWQSTRSGLSACQALFVLRSRWSSRQPWTYICTSVSLLVHGWQRDAWELDYASTLLDLPQLSTLIVCDGLSPSFSAVWHLRSSRQTPSFIQPCVLATSSSFLRAHTQDISCRMRSLHLFMKCSTWKELYR